MARFSHDKSHKRASGGLIAALVLFAAILTVFLFAIHSLETGNKARERETLEKALNRTIAYCYAVEGRYPESLTYMEETYGLTYNEEDFIVDYRVDGANLYPKVTILDKEVSE